MQSDAFTNLSGTARKQKELSSEVAFCHNKNFMELALADITRVEICLDFLLKFL